MPVTLDRLVSNVDKLQNQVNASLLQEFHNFMKNDSTSETYQKNNLKAMIHIAQLIARKHGPTTSFYEIKNKEQVLDILNTKIKSKQNDPEEKWRRTWRDYYEKIVYFYRWLYNVRMAKSEEDELPKELWNTPKFLAAIRKVKLKSKTPYSLRQIWEDKEEVLLAVKHETEPVRSAAITPTKIKDEIARTGSS